MTKFNYRGMAVLLTFVTTVLPAISYAQQAAKEEPKQQWRTLSPENTLYMETTNGRIIFELSEQFSPGHAKHIKQLVRSGFYDNLTFYRVIDGFVVQGGDPDERSKNPLAKKTNKAEFEWSINSKAQFTLVQSPDLLADQTGFIDGFAIGRNRKENKEWLISCPGVINLARSNNADSGTTDFAIMIGQAPRHLDRNMSIFGRVVHGKQHLNLIKRGDKKDGGMIKDPTKRSRIFKVSVAADLPKDQQLTIKIEKTDSAHFKQKLDGRRKRANDFYKHKGNGALDICYINVATQIVEN